VANRRLYRLATFEPPSLLLGQRLVLAAMNDLDLWVVVINASESEVDDDLFGDLADIFEQNPGLLQLG
jgi:hypothetical protein